jgi:hypothetical protein
MKIVKNELFYILGDFFPNSSGHPVQYERVPREECDADVTLATHLSCSRYQLSHFSRQTKNVGGGGGRF